MSIVCPSNRKDHNEFPCNSLVIVIVIVINSMEIVVFVKVTDDP